MIDPSPGGTSVAIVEDHELVLHGLEQLLATKRPALRVVWRGADIDGLLAENPSPDLILLDLSLGHYRVEPAQARELVCSGSKVLVVSAMDSPAGVRGMLQAGVAGFVSKVDGPQELLQAVDVVLAGELWTSHTLAAMLAGSDAGHDLNLSAQQGRVLSLYSRGLTIDSVARRLEISPHTVKTHLRRIRERCAEVGRPAPTATDLYKAAVREGIVQPG